MDMDTILALILSGFGLGGLLCGGIGYTVGHRDDLETEREQHAQHVKMILNAAYGRYPKDHADDLGPDIISVGPRVYTYNPRTDPESPLYAPLPVEVSPYHTHLKKDEKND